MRAVPSRRDVAAAALLAGFGLLMCLHYAQEIRAGGNSFKTGDWLISYAAGPMRRGLFGQAMLALGDLGLPLLWATYAVQVLLYAVVFWAVLRLYLSRPRGFLWLALLFSPAFLLFGFYDLQGGFRKEIIAFCAFVLLLLPCAERRLQRRHLVLASVLFGVGVLSHEMTAFTLPYFLYVLLLGWRGGMIGRAEAAVFAGLLSAMAVGGLVFSTLFQGGPAAVPQVCAALTSRGLGDALCDGAIHWLGKSSGESLALLQSRLGDYVLLYPFLFLVSFAPVVLTDWLDRQTLLLSGLGLLAMLPLYLIAIDWGRWIHIQVFFTFCLVLAADVRLRVAASRLACVVCVAYLGTWSVPYCCTDSMPSNLIAKLAGYAGKAHGWAFPAR